MGLGIGLGIGIPFGGIDPTPGGSANALLLEVGPGGFLLEAGPGDILMEA